MGGKAKGILDFRILYLPSRLEVYKISNWIQYGRRGDQGIFQSFTNGKSWPSFQIQATGELPKDRMEEKEGARGIRENREQLSSDYEPSFSKANHRISPNAGTRQFFGQPSSYPSFANRVHDSCQTWLDLSDRRQLKSSLRRQESLSSSKLETWVGSLVSTIRSLSRILVSSSLFNRAVSCVNWRYSSLSATFFWHLGIASIGFTSAHC